MPEQYVAALLPSHANLYTAIDTPANWKDTAICFVDSINCNSHLQHLALLRYRLVYVQVMGQASG